MTALPTQPDPSGRPSASLHFVVGEMSGKLDQLMLSIAPALTSLSGRMDRVEALVGTFVPRGELQANDIRLNDRVTTLERGYWSVIGLASIGGAAYTLIQYAPTLLHLTKVH